jgi:hypothetical protein
VRHRSRLREYVIAPVISIVVTLMVLALLSGLMVVLEPRSTNVAASPTTGYSSYGSGSGSYGSGTLGPWQNLLRRISTEDEIRDVLMFNGVFMFGDSIAVQNGFALEQLLTSAGDSIAVHDWSGQPTSAAVDALEQWKRDYGLPGRIVMAVGTNDIFDPPAFGAQVERAMEIAGPDRTVYWVNVHATRFRQSADVQAADRANSIWINQQLAEAAARHPNLRIIDWAGFVASQPNGLTTYLRDGVHTTDAGGKARNQLIADAIRSGR